MVLDDYNKEGVNKLLDSIRSLKLVDVYSIKSVDCLASSIIIAELLRQLNINFTLSFIDENNQLKPSKNLSILISDKENEINAYILLFKNKIKINPDFNFTVTNEEIPTSVLLYLISITYSSSNKCLSYIPIISNINNLRSNVLLEIISEAIRENVIVSGTSLALVDSSTRPLHKALEYSIEPYIPNISNKEDNAVSLLSSLDIKIKEDDKFTRLIDLDSNSLSKLTEAILIRNTELSTKQITKTKYFLKSEEYSSALKDLDEFSLLLEVSLLVEKYSIPIARCLSPKNYKNRSLDVLRDFRLKVLQVLEWVYENKKSVVEKDGFIMVNYTKSVDNYILRAIPRLLYSNFYINSGKSIIFSISNESEKIIAIHDEEANGHNIMKLLQDIDTKRFKLSNYKNTVFITFYKEDELELLTKINSYLNIPKIEQVA